MTCFPSPPSVREQQKLSVQYVSPAILTKQAQSMNQELIILLKENSEQAR